MQIKLAEVHNQIEAIKFVASFVTFLELNTGMFNSPPPPGPFQNAKTL